MPTLTPDEFLDYLKRSELLETQEYESTLAAIRKDAPDSLADANLLAEEFRKRDAITGWHVRQLMKRKYKGFYLRQYRILGHLGSGGMSAVYLAEHTVMKRRVAIKVLPRRKLSPVYVERFTREAQAIASLDHPHIVRAYDVDRFEDVHYIVMEYFEGQNLRQLVEKEGPLAYEDAASYIRQAALGLGHAHRAGVVHRDVKPENIVVNDQNLVKILDLGLALLDERTFSLQGSSFDEDKILGTADYLAPEQALDSHNVDARADVYGLGATLYFCLTGHPPFPFGSISERLLAHQRKEPASVFIDRPDAPVDLVEICAKTMAKKPDERFQSMAQVVDVMERWLVRHGFAKATDFARQTGSNEEGDEDVSDFNAELAELEGNAEERFLADATATELGSERGRFRLSDDELAFGASNGFNREDAVDLYDASETGSIFGARGRSATGRRPRSADFVLSQRNAGRVEQAVDPFEIALREIADTTKTKIPLEDSTEKSSTTANANPKSPNETAPKPVDVATARPQAPSSVDSNAREVAETLAPKREQAPRPVRPDAPEPLFGEWYKNVPIWFWTVAIGGYALAIFLAGILFTLLTNLSRVVK